MHLLAHIREEIVKGLLAPGAALPSIADLCQLHHLSRQTAGKALRILEDEGVIYREPGLGYFVSVSKDISAEDAPRAGRGGTNALYPP